MKGTRDSPDGQELSELCHIKRCRGFFTRLIVTTGHEIEYQILVCFRLSSKIGGSRRKTIMTAK